MDEGVKMQNVNDKEFTNFRYNRLGGIDADYNGNPYTLTDEEAEQVTEDVQPFDNESQQLNDSISQFKTERQSLLDSAVVETSKGYQFDADEQSISRMLNAIMAAREDGGDADYPLKWSLVDDGTGVMTDLVLSDLCEAHKLAVLNMASIWSIE